jgi:hypothetical protein
MGCFLWARGLSAKDIHKEIFPVYGGKCLMRKAVHNWAEKFSQGRRGWNGAAEVAETTVTRLPCCGFRRTDKAIGQVYQCLWRVCREINAFLQVRISHVLHFISIWDLFTDFPSHLNYAFKWNPDTRKNTMPLSEISLTHLSAAQYTERPINASRISRRSFDDVTD